MADNIEDIFTNFANNHENLLKEMGMDKEEFVDNAKQWAETEEGKLEIQKFILEQEVNDLKKEIDAIQDRINKKNESIDEINSKLNKL